MLAANRGCTGYSKKQIASASNEDIKACMYITDMYVHYVQICTLQICMYITDMYVHYRYVHYRYVCTLQICTLQICMYITDMYVHTQTCSVLETRQSKAAVHLKTGVLSILITHVSCLRWDSNMWHSAY